MSFFFETHQEAYCFNSIPLAKKPDLWLPQQFHRGGCPASEQWRIEGGDVCCIFAGMKYDPVTLGNIS